VTRPLDYQSRTDDNRPWPLWTNLLLAYVAVSAVICLYSVAGITYAQRKFGSEVIFEPATGTPFYEFHFVEMPIHALFYTTLLWLLAGGIWLGRREQYAGVFWLLMTVPAAFFLIFLAMLVMFWEPASP
jgi:hypothetical protein